MKAGEPTRHSDTSERQGNRHGSASPRPLWLAAVMRRPITLRAVKNFKRLIVLGALVALVVVLARKIREI